MSLSLVPVVPSTDKPPLQMLPAPYQPTEQPPTVTKSVKPISIAYAHCNKTGYHEGELINIVCTEKACISNSLCCCVCVDEEHGNHNTHRTVPLRKLLENLQKDAPEGDITIKDPEEIAKVVSSSFQTARAELLQLKGEVITEIDAQLGVLTKMETDIIEQISTERASPLTRFNAAVECVIKPTSLKDLHSALRTLVSLSEVKGAQKTNLKETIRNRTDKICKETQKNHQTIRDIQKGFLEILNNLSTALFTPALNALKFSTTLKHHSVSLVSPIRCKSSGAVCYKFALLEPKIQTQELIRKFAFKIVQYTSSWIALGVCHSKIVANNNYNFKLNDVGHGAYLISSNGGSWNNTKPDLNNRIKAYKFGKNDIITVTVNFPLELITFKCKTHVYEMPFETIPGDQLYACVTLYFQNDEVEFIEDTD